MLDVRTPRTSRAKLASPLAVAAIAAALLSGTTAAKEPGDDPVVIVAESAPARFRAPLPRAQDFPTGVARLLGWTDDARFAPRAHARDRLCAGDPDMWKRAEVALGASVQAGASDEDVMDTYGLLLARCPGDRCWAVPLAERMPGPAGLPPWVLAARCDSPAARRLFARKDVPARAMLARARSARYEGVRDRPPAARVGAAALEVIRAVPGDRPTAFDAAESGDHATIVALVEMARTTRDEVWRRDLRQALASSDDPAARAYLEPCRRSSEAARECALPWDDGMRPPPAFSSTDLDARVRRENIDDLIEKTSAQARPALLAALDGCAREDDRGEFYAAWHRVLCLRGVARLDRTRAAAAAPTLAHLADPDARELVAALGRYPAPGTLASRLRTLGLIPPKAKTDGISARDLLISAGAAAEFDVETSQFPNEHDTLLRELWALEGDAGAHALFGEEPPAEPDDARPYRLRAWIEGLRFETSAANLGDWYDVDAALRLLNAIERRRGTGMRFVVLGTRDQSVVVAYGPEVGLGAAISEGLLVTSDGRSAVDSGKAAEDVVRDRLLNGAR